MKHQKNRGYQKRSRSTDPGFVAVANPEAARAIADAYGSSKASRHDSRPRRLRTRQAVRRTAIKEW